MVFFALNGAAAALAGVPVVGYILGPVFRKRETRWIEAGAADAFRGATPKAVRLKYISSSGFKDRNVARTVWIRVDGDRVTTFSSECSHVGCNVVWKGRADGKEEAAGIFFCPCHGGEFDLEGNVLAGPPPAPLTRLPTKIEEGKLYIEV